MILCRCARPCVCVLSSGVFQRISTKFGTSDDLILGDGLVHPSYALEPEGSLFHLQEPATCPNPDPDQSSPRPHPTP
jgi:hypothetical protein